ncbi:KAT8 regulatory NSL complex subunit 1-like [Paramormyrops kingsleyae]|uniref:KAT8 regulatory NSL complex subunit 1 n=1 Tax=Paramormyrops kingsleyae TaxID=1676925 RepID=A0A3B3THV0_9TELE|nr:KAT8 regulatory NSL complex subunit 1-like [Paramormyrops kingsleyae]XP_023691313.1 KAT8 regulatory NSL complex subunit 1-like [Paramormyrops kingsleyae]XP_023691314.1 KAT8 regulatory NSL complex subunit 1-like [Paramormyrops kingsleyae]
MAAMAPALTDAPAEAHHMRFKLAPPSSTLSPGSVENNSNANNILVASNGTVKRRPSLPAGEECPRDFRGGGKEEPPHAETVPAALGKLPPLVTSYLCSDVTSVASTKDSLKIQGVLIKQSVLKSQGILQSPYFSGDDFLRRKQTLERSADQPKGFMSAGVQSTAPQVPVNGLTKKLATPSAEQDGASLVNGNRAPVSPDTPLPSTTGARTSDLQVCVLHKGGAEQRPADVSTGDDPQQSDPPSPCADAAQDHPAERSPKHQPSLAAAEGEAACDGPTVPNTFPLPPRSLDLEISDRTLLSHNRQNEIKGRLHRLRKRLQVVQAKQVERHVQQQLGGFLQTTLNKSDGPRNRSHAASRQEVALRWPADGFSSFLKNGSVSAELERFVLNSGTLLHAAEDAFDSDVTESSSGGETDVEEEELTKVDVEQRHVPLWRRAEGRYALERASIICHWNWLQAQVSDLEYRIRQQTDIYRQIRSNKGTVTLGDTVACDVSTEDGMKSEPISCPVTRVPGSSGAGCLGLAPLSKACASERPVNGMVNSVPSVLPDAESPENSDAEELLGKKQRLLPLAPPQDTSCVAARTRPVLGCRKRRLIRPTAGLGHKVQRPGRLDAGCAINPPCVMCGSSLSPFADFQYKLPLLERLSHFDPCVHPILSFSDDVSMNLHLQRVMKSHWQNKPLDKIKPLKKLSLKHKLQPGCRLPDSASYSKDKHKMTSLLNTPVRLPHPKVRPEKLSRQHLDSILRGPKQESRPFCKADRSQAFSHAAYERSHGRKRPRELSLDQVDAAPGVFGESGSPCSSLAGLHTPTHSPLVRQFSASSESPTPFALSQSAGGTPPIRRRRGESSFDINNIVIPMSVAATTRVEKLQYKEILTPSWRKVDISAQPIAEEDDSVEIEDLTDAAFSLLHLQYEEAEHSRWTWTASTAAKRRGSRSYKSLDGRTTPLLGSANPSTPQPSSPDMGHFHVLQDYSLTASPSSPASPDLISNPQTPGSRDSHRLLSSEDTRCSTPDFTFEEQPVQPWERRNFPLESDPVVEPADQGSPTDDQPCRGLRHILSCKTSSSKSESENDPPSPLPDDSAKQKGPGLLRFGHR